ncbi:MAG: hypothetical protein ABIQ16_17065 [Polyangiaceae bacterium]
MKKSKAQSRARAQASSLAIADGWQYKSIRARGRAAQHPERGFTLAPQATGSAASKEFAAVGLHEGFGPDGQHEHAVLLRHRELGAKCGRVWLRFRREDGSIGTIDPFTNAIFDNYDQPSGVTKTVAQWVDFAMTWNGTAVQAYVDGVLKSTNASSTGSARVSPISSGELGKNE